MKNFRQITFFIDFFKIKTYLYIEITKNITTMITKEYRERRSKGEKYEKIVGEFLDEYFYPTFSTNIDRNHDQDTQIQGLDLTVTGYDGVEYTIDEKAATLWIGRTLNTFAHEISSVNVSGNTYNGWFLSPQINQYYVYVWVDEVSNVSGKLENSKDITKATVVMADKQHLFNYMKKNNIKSSELLQIGEYLRKNSIYSIQFKGFKICMQVDKQEHAANILIPRDALINELSDYAVEINTKDANKVTVLHKTNNIINK